MVARVEEATFVPTALLATAAYWGSESGTLVASEIPDSPDRPEEVD